MKTYTDENSRSDGDVLLVLSPAEALVFYDWLRRSSEADEPQGLVPAEQRVLWDIEALLEKSLVEPFCPDYAGMLQKAREEVGE